MAALAPRPDLAEHIPESRAEWVSDLTWLLLRIVIGCFLIWGVWDNVMSPERMAEFARFLSAHGFVLPELMAPLSVYVQLGCGIGILAGLATRPAGLVCALNFIVALVMVDAALGPRGAFPSTMLIVTGLMLAVHGGGAFSLDRVLAPVLRWRVLR